MRNQNACLLARASVNGIVFECFELSADNDHVMQSATGLQRQFPAQSMIVTHVDFNDPGFKQMLSRALHVISSGEVDMSKVSVSQAESLANEQRDSQSPILVTQLLFAMLGVRGQPTHRSAFFMKTRDSLVLGSAPRPWRRSATWLALKVALRLVLEASDASDDAFKLYKNLQIYLHARLAQDLRRGHHVSIQNLHMVGVKLARRMHKLGDHVYGLVRKYAMEKLKLLQEHIANIWTNICACEQQMRIDPINREDVSKHLSLSRSAKSLNDILNRSKTEPDRRPFKPSSCTRGGFLASEIPDRHVFDEGLSNSSMFMLTDVEDWVAVNLDTWLSQCSGDSNDCSDICALATAYHDKAKDIYDKNPVLLSVMQLTLFDLLRCLDILACKLTPLLLQYSPELSVAHCESLLITKSPDLQRLRRIESHILERQGAASDDPLPSMFGALNENSFEVRFYDQSTELVQTHRRIEQDAGKKRDEKTEEHGKKNQEYDARMTKIETIEHKHPHGRPRPKRCERCREEIEVKKIYIEAFEWPLPDNDIEPKALICELDLDSHIRAWRDLTWLVVHDIMGRRFTDDENDVRERPSNYSLLQRYFEGERGRVELRSRTKSLDRKRLMERQTIPVDVSKVVVGHGLEWEQGVEGGAWTANQRDANHGKALCTMQLPSGDNELQCWVGGWTHTENEAIAAAHDKCPASISRAEYEAFGSLRAGALTTWPRILRHLRDSQLNLNAARSGILIRQAISQAGPDTSSCVLRDCHFWLAEPLFCTRLLTALCDLYESIKSNWTELHVLKVVLLLLMRLINFSPLCREQSHQNTPVSEESSSMNYDEELTVKACQLLKKVRLTSTEWSKELLEQTREHCRMNDENDNQARPALLQSALICKSSFLSHTFSDEPSRQKSLQSTLLLPSLFTITVRRSKGLAVNIFQTYWSLRNGQ